MIKYWRNNARTAMKYASNLRLEFPIFAGVRNYPSFRRAMKRRNLEMR